ncbi:helix-hairpin-helix domain-containing protein [Actinacidiphila epipremni]|nr:helix-hairpin-helix domain-containing protein [Actinacidiphila epipremni]
MRSIERGESAAAPAPRGDAAAARRRRREAMAAEAEALRAAEAAQAAGVPAPAAAAGEPGAAAEGAPDGGGAGADGAGSGAAAAEQGAEPEPEPGADGGAPRPGGAGRAARARGEGRRAARGEPVAVDPAAVAAVAQVLGEGGAPAELAAGVVRLLGEGAAQVLRDDPWALLGLAGVRVEQADGFARELLGAACGPADERRVRALVTRAFEDAALRGHTALSPADALAALGRYGLPDAQGALDAAVAEGQVLVFREGGADAADGSADGSADEEEGAGEGPVLLGLDRYAMAEDSLAEGFFRLLRSFAESGAGQEWDASAAPSRSAAELIGAVAGSGLVAHTGGEAARAEPAALVVAARAAGLRAYAAAYTENGRRRLAAQVGADAAVTVDGLMSGAEGPGRAPDGSLDLDLLAVLDAPQLSVEEAATLVESVPDGARLVLSGDPHGLWSAGPGRVFADLLASRACPRVVSRTPDPGPIGELVSCVGEGELVAVEAPGKEVVVVPVRDPGEAVHRTVQLVADSVPRAFGVEGPQVQVVTTGHGGPVGTQALNAALKERLNPGPGRFGGFDAGDRVVYVPGPGRAVPATVAGAEPGGLRLEAERGPVLVPREDVPTAVRHGWAVTGHQAAGMRWPAAVVVVPGDAGPLLTRSWVHTAFSRGERHLSVVQGAEGRLAQAVAGPAAPERTTRLTAALRELTAQS